MAEESAKRILVLEPDPDIASLLEMLLQEEGYQVDLMPPSKDPGPVVEGVRDRKPDLVIVDISPLDPETGYRLLDALRSDPVAQQFPVLASAESDQVAEASLASHNVKDAVTKPYNLDVLMDRVRKAIGLPPLTARIPTTGVGSLRALEQAKEILDRYSREVLLHWVEGLRKEEPWRDRTDLHLADVLDHAPVMIEAVSAALAYGDPDQFFKAHPDARERVLEHACTRCGQRIPLESLVREYTILRDEIWATLSRHLPEPIQPSDLYPLAKTVAGTLDRIVEKTIPAYVNCSGVT